LPPCSPSRTFDATIVDEGVRGGGVHLQEDVTAAVDLPEGAYRLRRPGEEGDA